MAVPMDTGRKKTRERAYQGVGVRGKVRTESTLQPCQCRASAVAVALAGPGVSSVGESEGTCVIFIMII
jgi:hypothetical protein